MPNIKLQTSNLKNLSAHPPNNPPPRRVVIGEDSPGNKFQPLYARPDKNNSISDSLGNTPNYSQPSKKLLKITEPLSSEHVDNIKQVEI